MVTTVANIAMRPATITAAIVAYAATMEASTTTAVETSTTVTTTTVLGKSRLRQTAKRHASDNDKNNS